MYCYVVNGFPILIPINQKSPLSESQLTEIHCTTVKQLLDCQLHYFNLAFMLSRRFDISVMSSGPSVSMHVQRPACTNSRHDVLLH